MQKTLSLLTIACICIFCLFVIPENTQNVKDYAILVYMNGSNLESDKGQASKAISQMLEVSGNEKFSGTFIVETGGTEKWHLPILKNTQNQRLIINNGKISELIKLETRSIGSPENFKDFLAYGIAVPAKHHILIFWNHGEGSVKGFGSDELHDHDTLTLPEMKKGFETSGILKKFDLIGFDTCLMSAIETAQTLFMYGEYMLASQETEKQEGWNYTIFSKLSDHHMTIENFAKSIMDEYIISEKKYSITLWKLDKAPMITKALNAALSRWENHSKALYVKALSARKDMLDFGGNFNQKNLNYVYPEMVDLDEVINLFAGKNKDILEQYSNAKKEAVLYHLGANYNKPPSGINIFLPYGKGITEKEINLYKIIGFSNKYTDFINEYYSVLNSKNDFELKNAPTVDEYDRCTLTIDNQDYNAAYISLFKDLGDRNFLYLGHTSKNVQSIKQKITSNRPKQWIMALNQPISIFEKSPNHYFAPMSLKTKGTEKNISIEFVFSHQSFQIEKISEIDEHLVSSRTLDSIKRGDTLTPLYPIFKFNDINKKYISKIQPNSYARGTEKPILFDNMIGLKLDALPDNYQARFMLEDLQGNQSYSLPCKSF